MTEQRNKVVLAYSGGLDTSVMIAVLRERYDLDVVAVHVDVGEAPDEGRLTARAKEAGACDVRFVAAREEFAEHFILPALKANAVYQGTYPLSAALSRPLIAKHLVRIAHETGAVAVAHGATGKGNDQVRFDLSTRALDPNLRIIAPQREHNMNRDEAMAFAAARGIGVPTTKKSPYSIDENFWGRSMEGGVLEDLATPPPDDVWGWTVDPRKAPDTPEDLVLRFEAGVPVALDGRRLPLLQLIEEVHARACAHGVGRIDMLENRIVGIKTRELYECPAATVLIRAHADLEAAVIDRHLYAFKRQVDDAYANLIYAGHWYAPLREALDAAIASIQRVVDGEVTVRLFKGSATVVARRGNGILYDKNLSTYGEGDAFDHRAAEGWIDIEALPLSTYRRLHPVELS
ncbi:MAG: argininosuccinate synthase [Deltaproteobacteria bacterium]|nr:MAG: argininosuccinate synthase [Deltaproteobacteria bacterium]